MAFCKNCGAQLADDALFCAVCGTPVDTQQAVQQYQAPQYTVPPYQPVPMVDPYDHTAEFDAEDIAENKVIAMAVYLFGVVGIILGLIAAPSSKYVGFHVRQALKLNITIVLSLVLCVVPVLGVIVAAVLDICLLVVMIICFVNVCKGKAKDAPIINKIKFLN